MTVLEHASLGNQISKKISAWILILVATVSVALLLVSFFLLKQMFTKQISIWEVAAPRYALTNLIDSDYFSIKREVEFLKSTELFSSFVVTDNQKRIISQFGDDQSLAANLRPIQDEANVVWGYYSFKPNFYRYISLFLVASVIFLILILIVYFIIRWRIRFNLELEFSRFNLFLKEIEKVTEKLHEIYSEDSEYQIDTGSTYTTEQTIINRAITNLLNEIKRANLSLREAISAAEQRRFQEELTRTALQVMHDLGSPIAWLEAIVESTSLTLPEKERTSIRKVTNRIRDIANSFLRKAQHDLKSYTDGPIMPHLLLSFIKEVISEKRMQYGKKINIDIQLDKTSYTLFAIIRPSDFCRVLSNLINNAIDAVKNSGHISVSLLGFNEDVIIKIEDNGRGIPANVLSKLGELGKSYGKPKGLGIGLSHAITTIQNWNGRLEVQSTERQGTSVQIYLPKTQPPSWFVPEIIISEGQTVVIIDDDESIHEIWGQRFEPFKHQIQLLHFHLPEELIEWKYKVNISSSILYLCDYEFIGSQIQGIQLITDLKINYLSILVTSRVSSDVISECESQNIKLLPKDIANMIPITI